MQRFSSSQTLENILSTIPEAVDLLNMYDIKAYSYTKKPLGEVIRDKGLEEREILDELHSIYKKTRKNNSMEDSYSEVTSNELIDFIINRYQNLIKERLEESYNLSKKILRSCGTNNSSIVYVNRIVQNLKIEFEEIMINEENIFEKIKNTKPISNNIDKLIDDVGEEFDLLDFSLMDFKEISKNGRIPREEFFSYWLIIKNLNEIKISLMDKIYFINNILKYL